MYFFFFKHKTAYEMRISDWSSDVCSSDLFGITQSKEYAEPEWYADLWLTLVWVVYLVAYMGTLIKREEPHIYVANWFYLAFIITIAMQIGRASCRERVCQSV